MQAQASAALTTSPTPVERYIMRRDEVERRTGFKRAHIYNLMKEGKFPRALRLGIRAVHDALLAQATQGRRLRWRVCPVRRANPILSAWQSRAKATVRAQLVGLAAW